MSPSNCVICYGPLDNNPAIDGAIIVCGECAIDPCLIAAAPALLEALVPLVDIAGSLLADRDGREHRASGRARPGPVPDGRARQRARRAGLPAPMPAEMEDEEVVLERLRELGYIE